MKLSEINELFYEEDGKLKWKIKRSRIQQHDEVGSISAEGYLQTQIKRKSYKVHRLLYQIYHNLEELPLNSEIDHRDHNKLNNHKSNLRLATKSKNQQNAKIRKDNTSGYKDIIYDSWINKKTNRVAKHWRVIIMINNVSHRKRFPYTSNGLLEAIKYRDNKLKELHGEFSNNGELCQN